MRRRLMIWRREEEYLEGGRGEETLMRLKGEKETLEAVRKEGVS